MFNLRNYFFVKKAGTTSGFTLLLAVVISGTVLSIGLTLSVITVKELTISGTFRDSMLAFYASESGGECARYWATKDVNYFKDDSSNPPIKCNNQIISPIVGSIAPNPPDISPYPTFSFDYSPGGGDAYKTEVTVIRKPGIRNEDVESKGYNTYIGGHNVQRYRKINVSGLCFLPDLMLSLDISNTIDPSELQIMKDALIGFLDILNINVNKAHLGITTFGTYGSLQSHISDNKDANVAIINSIPNDRYEATNISEGFKRARYELSNRYVTARSPECPTCTDAASYPIPSDSDNNHRRDSSPHIIVLITDGVPNQWTEDNGVQCVGGIGGICDPIGSRAKSMEQADLARGEGMEVYTIGIGDNLDEDLLKCMSSDPHNSYDPIGQVCSGWLNTGYYYRVDDFQNLNTIFKDIGNCVRPILEK